MMMILAIDLKTNQTIWINRDNVTEVRLIGDHQQDWFEVEVCYLNGSTRQVKVRSEMIVNGRK